MQWTYEAISRLFLPASLMTRFIKSGDTMSVSARSSNMNMMGGASLDSSDYALLLI
jgi:hypothetical protein